MLRYRSSILSAALLLALSDARADTLIVPSGYLTLQDAIDSSSNGDMILVEPGVFTGTGFTELNTLGKSIHIKSLEGPETTILDAEYETVLFFFRNGESLATIVEGFTLTRGYAGGIGGPAVHCREGSSPTILNCVLANNTNDDLIGAAGGAVWIQDSSPVFENCTITCNNTWADGTSCGDGIYITGTSSPTLRNSIVWGNDRGPHGNDGDICIEGGTLFVECSVLGTVIGTPVVDEHTVFVDPEFCSDSCPIGPVDPFEFRVSSASVCLPANNGCGELIGALGVGCPVASALLANDSSALRMYPNPTQDILYLETSNPIPTSVFAYDFQGRLVSDLTAEMSLTRPGLATVRVDGLPRGTYLIKILLDDASTESHRLVVR